jgi:F0F1-type ATP synthase delta subunit
MLVWFEYILISLSTLQAFQTIVTPVTSCQPLYKGQLCLIHFRLNAKFGEKISILNKIAPIKGLAVEDWLG